MVYSSYFALQHAHDARDARAHDHAHHKDGNKSVRAGSHHAMHMHTKVRHARKPSATRSYRPAETSRCPPPVDQSRAPDLRNTHFAPPSVGMKINALAGVLRRVFTHHEVIIDPLDREHRLGLAVVDVYVAHKVPQAPHRSPICATGRGVTRAGPACGCIKGTGNGAGGQGGAQPWRVGRGWTPRGHL